MSIKDKICALPLSAWLALSAAILAILGLAFYLGNTSTVYFTPFGIDPLLVALSVIAVVLGFANNVLAFFNNKILRIISLVIQIVLPCVLMAVFLVLLNLRLYYIVTILSFEKTGQNLSDLATVWVSLVFDLLALMTGLVATFLPLRKTEKSPK